MEKISIDKLKIENNVITTILGANNIGKSKLSKKLNKELNNSILLTHIPKNIVNTNIDQYLIDKLKVNNLFDYSFNTLSIGEKQIVQLIKSLNHDVIILDDALSKISNLNKDLILKYLSKTKKTIIYITTNKEDIIYGKYTILIDDEKIIMNDKTNNIMKCEKEFKMIGFELPFMALLSLKLKYYNLIDKPILNMNKMVDKLWK